MNQQHEESLCKTVTEASDINKPIPGELADDEYSQMIPWRCWDYIQDVRIFLLTAKEMLLGELVVDVAWIALKSTMLDNNYEWIRHLYNECYRLQEKNRTNGEAEMLEWWEYALSILTPEMHGRIKSTRIAIVKQAQRALDYINSLIKQLDLSDEEKKQKVATILIGILESIIISLAAAATEVTETRRTR